MKIKNIVIVLVFCFLTPSPCEPLGWDKLKTNLLANDCFALVEIKDGQTLRHCPHHDENGQLDMEQLIYVLGTFEQEKWLDPKNKTIAHKHLLKHYHKFMRRNKSSLAKTSVDLNKVSLLQLVQLPQIGPSLAVKIILFRSQNNGFKKMADIKKVSGVGQSTFNSIRYYIFVDHNGL